MKLDFSTLDQRNPMFLHPMLLSAIEQIMIKAENSLGPYFEVKILSTLRTPEEQLDIFKEGRELVNGVWQRKAGESIVTNVDGTNKRSNHNYQPSQACDFGIFSTSTGDYLTEQELYMHLGPPTREAGFTWGGDWNSFKDRPHIEIPVSRLFAGDRTRGSAIIWQIYLQKAGTYTGALDGLFGSMSTKALLEATGISARNRDSYRMLFEQFGRLSINDLESGGMGIAA